MGTDTEPNVELAIVTMRFDAADPASLLAVLSKYVVLTRMEPACRNVDLCASYTHPGRYLVIQKWDSVLEPGVTERWLAGKARN